jgi:hypothetical protein
MAGTTELAGKLDRVSIEIDTGVSPKADERTTCKRDERTR